MRKVLFFILSFTLILSALAQPQMSFNSSNSLKKIKPIKKYYSYKIIESSNKTFGYEIYVDKKIMIRQNTIPGKAGNQGFTTKKQAEMVAKIVTQKLQNGIMPPTITADELLKAGVK